MNPLIKDPCCSPKQKLVAGQSSLIKYSYIWHCPTPTPVNKDHFWVHQGPPLFTGFTVLSSWKENLTLRGFQIGAVCSRRETSSHWQAMKCKVFFLWIDSKSIVGLQKGQIHVTLIAYDSFSPESWCLSSYATVFDDQIQAAVWVAWVSYLLDYLMNLYPINSSLFVI